MAEMMTRNCKFCAKEFQARMADVRRGWARFCSKSCKAKQQEARTGQYADYCRRADSYDYLAGRPQDNLDDDPSWDAHKNP